MCKVADVFERVLEAQDSRSSALIENNVLDCVVQRIQAEVSVLTAVCTDHKQVEHVQSNIDSQPDLLSKSDVELEVLSVAAAELQQQIRALMDPLRRKLLKVNTAIVLSSCRVSCTWWHSHCTALLLAGM